MIASNSAIQTFKACRRLYELKYIHKLEPVQPAEALNRGSSYHKGVELLLREWIDYHDAEPNGITDPKISAMVFAFNKYIIPKLCELNAKPVDVEAWFEYSTPSGHKVVGRIDGLMSENRIIEHKTTSGLINGSYFQRLEMDEQIPTYMLAKNATEILYTVCCVPTLRRKKGETDGEFEKRLIDWYDEDTDSKISVCQIVKSPEELDKFRIEQDAILTEMENCKLFYRNPNHCMRWGRLCEYASVCMDYDPNKEYIQFKRREDHYDKGGEAKD